MLSATPFTTTLARPTIAWLGKTSKAMGVTRRALIETALEKYRVELEREEFKAGLRSVANDPDILGMAEEDVRSWSLETAR